MEVRYRRRTRHARAPAGYPRPSLSAR
jgi:hypothetical protein